MVFFGYGHGFVFVLLQLVFVNMLLLDGCFSTSAAGCASFGTTFVAATTGRAGASGEEGKGQRGEDSVLRKMYIIYGKKVEKK